MANSKPRVKVPAAAAAGEIVEIKALISHPMHTGLVEGPDGSTIPRNIINTFRVLFEGEEVFSVDLEPAVSANPFITFPFRAVRPGVLDFVWVEDGGAEFTASRQMRVG